MPPREGDGYNDFAPAGCHLSPHGREPPRGGTSVMADGTFRRLFHDEEHRREDYLDRQLEMGWEDSPADQALESHDRLVTQGLLEAREDGSDSFTARIRRRNFYRRSRMAAPALRRASSSIATAASRTRSPS